MDMLNGQRRVCRLQLFRIKVDSETYVADTSSECQEQNVKIDNSDNQDQEPVVEPENEPDSSKLEFFEDYFGDVDAEMDQDYVPEADDDSEVEENSTETDEKPNYMVQFEIDENEILEIFPEMSDPDKLKQNSKVIDTKFTFECYLCHQIIYCFENMHRHFLAVHKDQKINPSLSNWTKIKCYICDYSSLYVPNLRRHFRNCHPSVRFDRQLLTQEGPVVKIFDRDEKASKKKLTYPCYLCDFQFSCFEHLPKHFQVAHKTEKFDVNIGIEKMGWTKLECYLCHNYKSMYVYNVKRHFENSHKGQKFNKDLLRKSKAIDTTDYRTKKPCNEKHARRKERERAKMLQVKEQRNCQNSGPQHLQHETPKKSRKQSNLLKVKITPKKAPQPQVLSQAIKEELIEGNVKQESGVALTKA